MNFCSESLNNLQQKNIYFRYIFKANKSVSCDQVAPKWLFELIKEIISAKRSCLKYNFNINIFYKD